MKNRRITLCLLSVVLLSLLLCACAPKELQGSFDGKYDLRHGTLSNESYRISFYGDGRGTVSQVSKEYTESFTYSANDSEITLSFDGQDDLRIKYTFDSEESVLTLYTADSADSCDLSSVKE